MRKYSLALYFVFGALSIFAQAPGNDDCDNPIVLPDVVNFCSSVGAYTNVDATPSTYGAATCFGSTQNDVWFAFTPVATDVTVTIRGATSQGAGGTLKNPQVAIYFGTCGGTINQLECQSGIGTNVAEAYQGGLFVGSTYFIRVQGTLGQTGTFQLCINNYNPPVEPTSDCPQASILCDKSSFVVQKVTGAGQNQAELTDATCFSNGAPGNYETNSTWFVWTCSQSGSLEFTLTPLNVGDDLDFVLYRLPNGIGNCAGKEVVRCNAAGDNSYPSPCMGPTGLQSGDNDISEDAGCTDNGDNAWLSPFSMVAGESYALVINNFTSTNSGFNIEFGGSGQFLGPEAEFTTVPSAVCLGTPVEIVDASTFPIGSITEWNWSFGADALPQTATGPGPHTVQFNSPGQHPVVLTVKTNLGCKVTAIQNTLIYPDVVVAPVIAAPDCNGTMNGSIEITNITMGTPPYQFSWDNGPFQSSNMLNNLGVGTVALVIKDANNCSTDLTIDVQERILTADAVATKPLCFGDDNGTITLNVTNGKDPVQFDWGNGFIPENMQGGFVAGNYTIQAIDAVLCKGTFNVEITDNPPLQLALDTLDISCFGANDGMAQANPSGGVGNYTYTWSDGQTVQKATSLGPGEYMVTVNDGNECSITGSVFITEPADVSIDLLGVVNLLCNGVPAGEIDVSGVGGKGNYQYSVDGLNFVSTSPLTGLAAGDYWVIVRDAAGCIDSVMATITQPVPVTVTATPTDTTLELGYTVDITTFTTPFGRPVTYEWTPTIGISDPTVPNLTIQAVQDQLYVVKVTDEDGCMGSDTVRILVNKNRPIYVPNVFAPDKPYPNDHFTLFAGPAGQAIDLLRVYDRWGSLIFETRNIELGRPELGWDGTYKGDLVNGVFTFYASVRFIDQETVEYKGSVTVVR